MYLLRLVDLQRHQTYFRIEDDMDRAMSQVRSNFSNYDVDIFKMLDGPGAHSWRWTKAWHIDEHEPGAAQGDMVAHWELTTREWTLYEPAG